MKRLVPIALLATLFGSVSCGGGGVTSIGPSPPPSPPPPAPDFSLTPEDPMVTLQQQGAPQFEEIIPNPINGFTGTVTVTLSGLPTGVTAMPPGPYSVSTSGAVQGVTFQLIASSAAAATTTQVTVTGTSGSITHTATFNMAVSAIAPFVIHLSTPALSLTPASSATVQVSLTANAGTSPQLVTSVTSPPGTFGVNINGPESLLSPTNPVSFTVQVAPLTQPLQNYPLLVTASDNSNNTSAVV